jgi:hypothetical protein
MVVSATSALEELAVSWLTTGLKTKSFLKQVIGAEHVVYGVGDDFQATVVKLASVNKVVGRVMLELGPNHVQKLSSVVLELGDFIVVFQLGHGYLLIRIGSESPL